MAPYPTQVVLAILLSAVSVAGQSSGGGGGGGESSSVIIGVAVAILAVGGGLAILAVKGHLNCCCPAGQPPRRVIPAELPPVMMRSSVASVREESMATAHAAPAPWAKTGEVVATEALVAASVSHLNHVLRNRCHTAICARVEAAVVSGQNLDGKPLTAERPLLANPMEATVWHMVWGHVRPLTATLHGSYVDWIESEYAGEDVIVFHRGPPAALLSYSWTYRYLDVIDALVEWNNADGRDPKQTCIWICALNINQHEVGDPGAPPAALTGPRVEAIGRMLAMLYPASRPVFFARLGCVFEAWAALTCNCNIEVIIRPGELPVVKMAVDQEGQAAVMDRMSGAINSAAATATEARDRDFMVGVIETNGGFAALDDLLRERFRTLFLRMLRPKTGKRRRVASARPGTSRSRVHFGPRPATGRSRRSQVFSSALPVGAVAALPGSQDRSSGIVRSSLATVRPRGRLTSIASWEELGPGSGPEQAQQRPAAATQRPAAAVTAPKATPGTEERERLSTPDGGQDSTVDSMMTWFDETTTATPGSDRAEAPWPRNLHSPTADLNEIAGIAPSGCTGDELH